MALEMLLAIRLPVTYIELTTAVLAQWEQQLPRKFQQLNARDALLWNTMAAITIA